ncbi:putative Zn-dependent hydrolase [Corynebacterium renale]|uniref:Glyoxylase-like metal-dependent hydrolase (Beta-lactamase superfamily II) n=2 Tax=Corynebacterium renale TaxID=1724 RepID=A0A2A9DRS3_9CORY|nr:glyoxylase-like metal-dependent hydrolase (beta-lactamase superfamily II) [Corynebacterium renale]SQI26144.1 putative Zn-dependent hydrolase [Corynebacterium renale]
MAIMLECMQILGFPAGPFKTNCYLVQRDGLVSIIDPGMHAAGRIRQTVQDNGWSVDKIVLTHGHIDHTRDAAELAKEFDVDVYCHPDDAFMLLRGEGVSDQTALLFDAQSMDPITAPESLLDDQTLTLAGAEFTVKHCPGHSPGCVILVGEDVVFSGDVLFRGAIGRVDLPHSDPEAMRKSLAGPVWALADKLAVLPGHGQTSTMEYERETNPFLQHLR